MDEPLSNLDARLREEVRREIKSLTTSMGVTTLYVTHDQAEAMELADRIAVMDKGRVLQIGSAEDLYQRPKHPKVAQFLGSANWFSGTVMDDEVVRTNLGDLTVDVREISLAATEGEMTVAIRPEAIRLFPPDADVSAEENILFGQIVSHAYFGDHRLYTVQVGNDELLVKLPSDQHLTGRVAVTIPRGNVRLFALAAESVLVEDRKSAL